MAKQFNTDAANKIYISLLDYFIMCDDPKYSILHSYYKAINKVTNLEDYKKLVNHFENETKENFDYFVSPY